MSHTMLYKCPGPHKLDGTMFDYQAVADEEVDAALKTGWHLTQGEAKAAHEASKLDDLTGDSKGGKGKGK